MAPEDALTPAAEIAIALAGFTGVIVVFRRAVPSSGRAAEERLRIQMLLVLCFNLVVCALLPFAISGYSDAPRVIWGVPLFVYAAVNAYQFVGSLGAMRVGGLVPVGRSTAWAAMSGGLIVTIVFTLSAFGVGLEAGPGLLVLGLIWGLLMGGLTLTRSLAFIWQDE